MLLADDSLWSNVQSTWGIHYIWSQRNDSYSQFHTPPFPHNLFPSHYSVGSLLHHAILHCTRWYSNPSLRHMLDSHHTTQGISGIDCTTKSITSRAVSEGAWCDGGCIGGGVVRIEINSSTNTWWSTISEGAVWMNERKEDTLSDIREVSFYSSNLYSSPYVYISYFGNIQ